MRGRFKILFGGASVLAVALTAGALIWISSSGTPLRLHLVIAITLSIFLSLMLAAALMGLVFFSNESGHDQSAADEAAKHDPDGWQDED